MPDVVRVEGLELQAEVGVFPHEHGIKQKLVVDLAVECDIRLAAASDAIADATDYDRLASIARTVVSEKHHALIETVAEKIAALVLLDFAERIERVFVRVAKPGAVPDAKTVAVEIWRAR